MIHGKTKVPFFQYDATTIPTLDHDKRAYIAAFNAGKEGGWDCAFTAAHTVSVTLGENMPPARHLRQQLRHLGIARSRTQSGTGKTHHRIVGDAVSHALGEVAE